MKTAIREICLNKAILCLVLFLVSGCITPLAPQAAPASGPSEKVIFQGETSGIEQLATYDIDNCNGKADLTRIEHRGYSVEATISSELAASLGASAEIISAEVRAAVGAAQTTGMDRATEAQLVAPPGTHMIVQLFWIGTQQIGVVQNYRGLGVPIAFTSFVPTDWRMKSQDDIGCPTPDTPSHAEPTTVGTLPLPTRQSSSQTAMYVISVPAFQENGITFKVPLGGTYQFEYKGDAYSPWPSESYPGYRGWSTLINLYVNTTVKWGKTPYGLEGPVQFSAWMGTTDYYSSAQQAAAASIGQSRTFHLETGDYVILVVVDERGQYSDNRGQVGVTISYLGSQ